MIKETYISHFKCICSFSSIFQWMWLPTLGQYILKVKCICIFTWLINVIC